MYCLVYSKYSVVYGVRPGQSLPVCSTGNPSVISLHCVDFPSQLAAYGPGCRFQGPLCPVGPVSLESLSNPWPMAPELRRPQRQLPLTHLG